MVWYNMVSTAEKSTGLMEQQLDQLLKEDQWSQQKERKRQPMATYEGNEQELESMQDARSNTILVVHDFQG